MMRCIECGKAMKSGHAHKKYCSGHCKARHRKKHGGGSLSEGHKCRMCGKWFPLLPGQSNKWLCSDVCRRASNAKSAREFHKRRPLMEAIYRAKTKAKTLPDNANVRFYRLNPKAPKLCEACGESRVTEVAHKPGHERFGARRTNGNLRWPEMTWILCPTCHRLLDRMGYSPDDLGLKV